jgi:hypothetical protein
VDWTALPDELLRSAFAHLDTLQRLTVVAHVCPAWQLAVRIMQKEAVDLAHLVDGATVRDQDMHRTLAMVGPGLRTVDLSFCTAVSEATLHALLVGCPHLHTLVLAHINMSYLAQRHLSAMHQLHHLDLTGTTFGPQTGAPARARPSVVRVAVPMPRSPRCSVAAAAALMLDPFPLAANLESLTLTNTFRLRWPWE